MMMQRASSHKVESQQLGKSGYLALTWSVSGEVILMSIVTQKIRTDPLNFQPLNGGSP